MGDLTVQEMRDFYYNHVHRTERGRNEPRWRGVRVVKFPSDLALYAEVIYANKPDFIIETGTRFGGSALFLADMLEINGKGKVITVDVAVPNPKIEHPRIQYILGPSTDAGILNIVRKAVNGGSVMAVLDSDHSRRHVKRELIHYGRIVTPGQFMVVEDCYTKDATMYGPGEAVEWYLSKTSRYRREPMEDRFIFAVSRGGWLKRVR